jgi:tRNA 2-thiouridine synthesizing protein A
LFWLALSCAHYPGRKKIKEMKVGEVLEVISTDAGIREDMPAWCRLTGQEYLGLEEEGEAIKVYVRKVKE